MIGLDWSRTSGNLVASRVMGMVCVGRNALAGSTWDDTICFVRCGC